MKRARNLWSQIVSYQNLERATLRAARGKRRVAGVARFMERRESEILALRAELEAGSYRPGRPFEFEILDPKPRTISAAPFRDRVVHHALIAPLEPVFEARMVHESFACRRGKGQHRALRHAQRLVRRHGWFLKMDVRRYFPSLRHDVVLETVARVVKDHRVLALVERIVRAGGASGRGLPIGNLTSQWFANLVLDRLDHHIKEHLRTPGYVRYLDDFALFADHRTTLRAWRRQVVVYLRDVLGLEEKVPATILAPSHCGMPFVGWQVFPRLLRLRPANLARSRARLRHRLWQHARGKLDAQQLADSLQAMVAHLRTGNTLALRRALFARCPEHPGNRSQPPATASTGAAASTAQRATRVLPTATTTPHPTATTISACGPPPKSSSGPIAVLRDPHRIASTTPMPR